MRVDKCLPLREISTLLTRLSSFSIWSFDSVEFPLKHFISKAIMITRFVEAKPNLSAAVSPTKNSPSTAVRRNSEQVPYSVPYPL